jgi:rhamnose utilization protein RhaD (predicted bifunctional aldolase and dehydrogenase)/NAD(P)-dependent dehydrogenase (short-subunit alcohol dehydrogenase family)
MQSLWDDQEAAAYSGDLAQRVYTSRLLGRDPALVLHGGGNTSVKIRETNIFGEEEDILYVKGSGWDLATIEAAGFAPVRMRHLLRLAKLDALSDIQMANEQRLATINPAAPAPSVEAILHAILPYTFVDHTHADALISVSNTAEGDDHVRRIYGDRVVVVPYVMPGFELAKVCAALYPEQAGPRTIGMVLMNHGLFSFGENARVAYERMIELVSLAEQYLADHGAWRIAIPSAVPPERPLRHDLAALRRDVSAAAGAPVILAAHTDEQALAFTRRGDLATVSQQGPATPDHIIRTKRLPQIGRDVAAYAAAYKEYFAAHSGGDDRLSTTDHRPGSQGTTDHGPRTTDQSSSRSSVLGSGGSSLQMLDPAPRIILDPELGLCTVGRTVRDAAIAEEIYRHTIDIILRATALGGFQALGARELFDVEYWDLEQAKLKKGGLPPLFAGEVALVTGAASGIGKACVESLLARGAAVAALDVNPAITEIFGRPDVLGVRCDVADEEALRQGLEATVRAFGGLDMLILNAGIFPASHKIADLPLAEWDRAMRVNLDANLALLREAHPLLKLAPRGGRVAAVGSKNVPAPGPGAAAYSASKAALTQLARVAALEWGGDGIRVNVLHPDAVFDTGLWTEEVLRSRAASYGLTVEQYKIKNVLRAEVGSRHVAELAAELCGPLFARTTGAQIPVDGGNDRVI